MIDIDSTTRTRFRVLIDNYFVGIAIALILISASGGYLTYTTAVDPGTHTEKRTGASWKVNGTFNHSARVTNDTPVFDTGQVLTDRPYYFMNASPVLNGQFRFQVGGETGKATVTTQSTLVQYAIHDKTKVRMWNISYPIKTDRKQLSSGEAVTIPFTINVTTMRERIKQFRRVHGSSFRIGDVRAEVIVSARVTGTINGMPVNRTFNYSLPINSAKGYYAVSPPMKQKEMQKMKQQKKEKQRVRVTNTVRVPNRYGPLAIIGSIAALVVPLVVLTGLVYGKRHNAFDVSPAARADAKRAKLRSEFDAWVTTGTVGTADDGVTVTVDSLEGLVDIAIDSDRRVIESTDSNEYVILDDAVRYQFTPDTAEKRGPALSESTDTETKRQESLLGFSFTESSPGSGPDDDQTDSEEESDR